MADAHITGVLHVKCESKATCKASVGVNVDLDVESQEHLQSACGHGWLAVGWQLTDKQPAGSGCLASAAASGTIFAGTNLQSALVQRHHPSRIASKVHSASSASVVVDMLAECRVPGVGIVKSELK